MDEPLQIIEPKLPCEGRAVYRPDPPRSSPLREVEITMKVRVPHGVSVASLRRELRRAVFEHAQWTPDRDVLSFGVKSATVTTMRVTKKDR